MRAEGVVFLLLYILGAAIGGFVGGCVALVMLLGTGVM